MKRPDTSDYRQIFLQDLPLIDTRAPVEFARGAFPTARNLPLMLDDERAAVGTCYKQRGQQAAIDLGHQLVSGPVKQDRVQAWVDFARANPQGYIYCFRGGMRSAIAQQWMSEAGQDFPRIQGGYKAMRSYLIDILDTWSQQARLFILGGRTGTGKTDVIQALDRAIDLEALAHHRGSSFGRHIDPQPTQIDFENRLAIAALKLRATAEQEIRPICLEDESRRIGQRSLPKRLHQRMQQQPLVILETSREERIQVIMRDYVHQMLDEHQRQLGERRGWSAYREWLLGAMDRIRKRLGDQGHRELRAIMEHALDQHQYQQRPEFHHAWIEQLLDRYYDPMYDYQITQRTERIAFQGPAEAVIQYLREHLQQPQKELDPRPPTVL